MLKDLAEIIRYRELTSNLVSRDLKVKYKSSVLGFLWSLLNPLLMMMVYTVAFRYILEFGEKDFAFYFIVAFLPWNFFAMSVAFSVSTVVDNGNLLKKVYFPREILPLSVVLSSLVQFLLTGIVLVPAFIYFHHGIGLSILFLPIVILFHVIFTLGVALILSTLYVYFRDTRHFVEILLNIWFWVTPIIYRMDSIRHDSIRDLLSLNPMTQIIVAYRDILYRAQMPEPAAMAEILVVSVLTLFVGQVIFARYKWRFAEAI